MYCAARGFLSDFQLNARCRRISYVFSVWTFEMPFIEMYDETQQESFLLDNVPLFFKDAQEKLIILGVAIRFIHTTAYWHECTSMSTFVNRTRNGIVVCKRKFVPHNSAKRKSNSREMSKMNENFNSHFGHRKIHFGIGNHSARFHWENEEILFRLYLQLNESAFFRSNCSRCSAKKWNKIHHVIWYFVARKK